jgi:hypothetical protein
MNTQLLLHDINTIIFSKYFTIYEKIQLLTVNKEICGIVKKQIQPYIAFLTKLYEFLYKNATSLIDSEKISHYYLQCNSKNRYLRQNKTINNNMLTLDNFIYIMIKKRSTSLTICQTRSANYIQPQIIKNITDGIKKIRKEMFQSMYTELNGEKKKKKIKIVAHTHDYFQTDIVIWRGW